MKQGPFENILGFPVTTLSRSACVDRITGWIASNDHGRHLVCANPHSLVRAQTDLAFAEAVRHADLVVPDGVGTVVASWILGGGIRRRLTGSAVFRELSRALDPLGGARYFFLGSTPENLVRIRDRLALEFPGIRVVGSHSPPFAPAFSTAENRRMIDAVNRSRPHVLWVGMTAPKQEKWVYRHHSALHVPFIASVGAVFDFYPGSVKRTSPWLRDRGLEWLPRLFRQPGRLWRRTLVSAPVFLVQVLRQRIGKTHP